MSWGGVIFGLVIIIGAGLVTASESSSNKVGGFIFGALLGLLVFEYIRFNGEEKEFICEDVQINGLMANEINNALIDSKMYLKTYDEQISMTLVDKPQYGGNKGTIKLNKIDDGFSDGHYNNSENGANVELKKFCWFIYEVKLTGPEGSLTFKRSFSYYYTHLFDKDLPNYN